MAKNNNFINKQKHLAQQIESMVPATYAAIAIALDKFGIGYKDIDSIFSDSQEIWENNKGDIISILIQCYNKKGIQLMSDKQYNYAVKNGLIEEED